MWTVVQAGSEARLGGTFLRAVGRGVEGRTKGEGDGGWEGTGAEKPGRNIDNGIVLEQGYCKRMRMKDIGGNGGGVGENKYGEW